MPPKSLGDQQLDEWLAKGVTVDHGAKGCLGLFTYLGYLLIPGIPIGAVLALWHLLTTGNILNP